MKSNKLSKLQCYQWAMTSNKARDFLTLILPYLKLKKPQAEIAIKFQASKNSRHFRELTEEETIIEEAQRIMVMGLHGRKQKS